MRKSERLRLLELQVVRMELYIELLTGTVNNLLDSREMVMEDTGAIDKLHSDLQAGKWYQKKLDN
jgi:ParB-like chromosome segregation protein Spo0J